MVIGFYNGLLQTLLGNSIKHTPICNLKYFFQTSYIPLIMLLHLGYMSFENGAAKATTILQWPSSNLTWYFLLTHSYK